MNRALSLCIILMAAGVVAGCSGNLESFSDARPQVVTAPDKVSAMLADAADRAATALETLSAIENARAPDVAVAPVSGAPIELRRAITLSWVGPVEPVAKMLSERAGYDFVTVGTLPPVPIIVNLDVENKPVIEVLRNLGLQLGVRADIRVDSGRRVVELHYPPTTGLGNAGL